MLRVKLQHNQTMRKQYRAWRELNKPADAIYNLFARQYGLQLEKVKQIIHDPNYDNKYRELERLGDEK